jgi:hypothetical protein
MVAVFAVWPAAAAGQSPHLEAGAQTLGVLADRDYLGAGPWLGWRVAPSIRLGMLATIGTQEQQTAGRVEVTAHFLLDPGRTTGIGVYGAAGAAWSIAQDNRGFLVVGVGVEGSPGAAGGWIVEIGAGGGWRATAGYRWRFGSRRPAP